MKRALLTISLMVLMLVPNALARVKFVPIEEMPGKADFVVVGTVVDSFSQWDDRGVMINTHYRIQVEEDIVGVNSAEITLIFAGGTVDGRTIVVTHTPLLSDGEKYIIFGYEGNKYSVPVVGHEQGIFRVVHDQAAREDLIVDYNWYQLEETPEGKLIRGPRTELDDEGSLRVQSSDEPSRTGSTPEYVVRDTHGREISQEGAVFQKPVPRRRGVPVTRDAFIRYIRARALDKRLAQ